MYGEKARELRRKNEQLEKQLGETREEINRLNVHQAFRDRELSHIPARDFLEENPVPYNFGSVIRDYRLLDVFGESMS